MVKKRLYILKLCPLITDLTLWLLSSWNASIHCDALRITTSHWSNLLHCNGEKSILMKSTWCDPPAGSWWVPTGWSSCCETAVWPGRSKTILWPRNAAWMSQWRDRCSLESLPRRAVVKRTSRMKSTPRRKARRRQRARSRTLRGTAPVLRKLSCDGILQGEMRSHWSFVFLLASDVWLLKTMFCEGAAEPHEEAVIQRRQLTNPVQYIHLDCWTPITAQWCIAFPPALPHGNKLQWQLLSWNHRQSGHKLLWISCNISAACFSYFLFTLSSNENQCTHLPC